MNMKSERGAVIIEAALSLTMFMFAMLTVYSMYNICLAQARITSALNATAKEISQYSYIYDLTGLNSKQSGLADKGGAAESSLSDDLSEVNSLYDALMGLTSTVISVGEDPESFLYYTLNQGVEQVKGSATGMIAQGLMRKHFGEDPDAFLRHVGVKEGMKGLDFSGTRLFEDGQGDDILLNLKYKITVIKLLDVDITFDFELCAKTKAWTA